MAVVDRVREAVATLFPEMKKRGEIPAAAQITLLGDQSLYIRNAMHNLSYEVAMGAVLVTIVVFVFLRRLLPTLAIVIVIFLSLTVGGWALLQRPYDQRHDLGRLVAGGGHHRGRGHRGG